MSYPLQVTLSWIASLTLAALVFLAAECAPKPAHAGQWAIDLKGGVSWPIRTTPDGTYWQQAYPHDTKPLTGAYGIGLSYQYTPTLSFQAHYLDLGTSRIKGYAITDEHYDFKAHRCKYGPAECTATYGYRATDSLRGGDLTATYTWEREGLQPFVKGGLALLYHQAIFRHQNGDEDRFNGWIPALELGAGLSYKLFYVELDYFQGMNFGGQNLPISTQQVVAFFGVQIPLGS